MRMRYLAPWLLLLAVACGGEDATAPEPAKCKNSPLAFSFGFYLIPLADQNSLDFSGTVKITNEPENRTGAGAESLPISLSLEMDTDLPVSPELSFDSPLTELLIPPDESTEITFNVVVTQSTSPGLHKGRVHFGSLCSDATFSVELEGRPMPPPVYVGAFGVQGAGAGEFESPESMVFDDAGRIYVADTGNDRVQVFDADWNLLFQLKETVSGKPDLAKPSSVAVQDGLIVVGDVAGAGRISTYDLDGTGELSFGHNRPSPQFTDFHRLALDAAGLIYATDGTGQRVEVFHLTGEDVGWERVNVFGSGGDGAGQFHLAYDIQVRDDELFVSDMGGDRIDRFSLTGEFLSRWGDRGTNGGKFKGPRGLAFTKDGDLLVVDSGNRRIQMLTPDGGFLTSWGATKGDAAMESPRDVAVDATGDIYVVDGVGANRILRFRFP